MVEGSLKGLKRQTQLRETKLVNLPYPLRTAHTIHNYILRYRQQRREGPQKTSDPRSTIQSRLMIQGVFCFL